MLLHFRLHDQLIYSKRGVCFPLYNSWKGSVFQEFYSGNWKGSSLQVQYPDTVLGKVPPPPDLTLPPLPHPSPHQSFASLRLLQAVPVLL